MQANQQPGVVRLRAFYTLACTAAFLLCRMPLPAQDLLQYVQPMSGTAPSSTAAALLHSETGSEKNANTIPSVTLPFAMTQWTAQTRTTETKCQPPYFYRDSLFTGFRGTHWLSGSCTQDYGSFTLMPVCGKLTTASAEYALPLVHAQETSTPAYYKINFLNQQLVAEMTATLRCGFMRFTLQRRDSLYLLVMPNSDKDKGFVRCNAATGEIWGYNPAYRIYQGWGTPAGFNGWFYIKIDRPILKAGSFSGNQVFSVDSIRDKKDLGLFIGFAMKKGEQLLVRIGTSFSSLKGAKKNLQQELGSMPFKAIVTKAQHCWQKALSQLQVQTNNAKDKRMFYTAMYHAMQHPRLMSDVDGTYPKFAGNYQLMHISKGNYYDDFSMWDIYRAQLPLLELLQPSLTSQLLQSLVLKGQQGGWLPIFPCWNSYTAAMIGDHSTAFIASAYNKGIRQFNIQAAYALMRKNAFETPASLSEYKNGMGRRALSSYLKYGFIPMEDSVQDAFHKKEQVSRTLEYAFDDYALSVFAKAVHRLDDYNLLKTRAFNYRNVFDTTVGMVRGRYAGGKWYEDVQPDQRQPFITEGTPRQYSFYVPQDIAGLTALMGGAKKLENALDSLFVKKEYWHGNEPGHQIPFIYNYTAAPWKTQETVQRILREEYSDGAGGLSGNDDAGQMSAWFVFAAMGFYPVDPVSNNYQVCTPLFHKISMRLPNGRRLIITCTRSSPSAVYISDVHWNGLPYSRNFFTYEAMMKGGEINIRLSATPGPWGSSAASRSSGLTTTSYDKK